MAVVVFDSLDKELKDIWVEMERDSVISIFQTWDWLSNWTSMVGFKSRNINLCIAVVSDDYNNAVAIFPLCKRRIFGWKVLEFIGGESADYMSPIYRNGKYLDQSLASTWFTEVVAAIDGYSACHLQKIPESFGGKKNPMLDSAKLKIQGQAYSRALPEDWNDVQKSLRKRLWQDNNRQRRRLSELGTLKFRVADPMDSDYASILSTTIDQKRARYKATGVPDIFSDSNVRDFYSINTGSKIKIETLHLSVLQLDDKIIATHWGAVYNGTFYYLMPTYVDSELSKFSPGKLLLQDLVEHAVDQGLRVFDFTVGGEEYKRDWCDTEIQYFQYVAAKTIVGYGYLILINALGWARKNEKLLLLAKVINKNFHRRKSRHSRENW